MTKPTRSELAELFRRTSDCLAQTIDDSRVHAMTGKRFLEVVAKLLDGRIDDIKPTVWIAGGSGEDVLDSLVLYYDDPAEEPVFQRVLTPEEIEWLMNRSKERDQLFIEPRVEPLLDLTASVIDLETGEEMLKPPSQADIESWTKPAKQSYRIVWRSLVTGVQGHGEPMTLDESMSALKAVDPKWTGIISHWIELVPQDDDREAKS